MHPVLVEIGSFEYHTYGAALVCGFLAMLGWAHLEARRRGLEPWFVNELGIVVLLGAVVGGRLFYVVEHAPHFAAAPWGALMYWEGGMTSMGSGLGALLAGSLLAFFRRQPVRPWLDAFAPGCALAQVVVRLGCFSAGCGWGKVTDWPWAITFIHPQTLAPRYLPLHPTQILLAGVGAVSFLVLIGVRRRMLDSPGRLMGLFAMLYAGMRFPIEYLRGDVLRVSEWWSSTQILLVLVFLFGIWLVTRGHRFGPASLADSQRPEVVGVDAYLRVNNVVAAGGSEA